MRTIRIAIDKATAERAVELLPGMRAAVPEADLAYVYSGAVRVGLNGLLSQTRLTAGDLASKDGAGIEALNVQDADMERASQLAVSLEVPLDATVGAAVCTGLSVLTTKSEPFLIGVTPLAAPPIVGPFRMEG